jgi:hypothetical protein
MSSWWCATARPAPARRSASWIDGWPAESPAPAPVAECWSTRTGTRQGRRSSSSTWCPADRRSAPCAHRRLGRRPELPRPTAEYCGRRRDQRLHRLDEGRVEHPLLQVCRLRATAELSAGVGADGVSTAARGPTPSASPPVTGCRSVRSEAQFSADGCRSWGEGSAAPPNAICLPHRCGQPPGGRPALPRRSPHPTVGSMDSATRSNGPPSPFHVYDVPSRGPRRRPCHCATSG